MNIIEFENVQHILNMRIKVYLLTDKM